MSAQVTNTELKQPKSSQEKRTVKQRAYEELKEFLAISLYLWVVFALFLLYRSVLLSEGHFPLMAHGFALINALALGKIVLIAQGLHFAEDMKGRPLIYPTLYKSAAFAVILGIFKVIEEAGIGWYHGKSFTQSIADLGGGTLEGILALVAILAVLLIPFFAFSELRGAFGEGTLRRLFFTSDKLPSSSA